MNESVSSIVTTWAVHDLILQQEEKVHNCDGMSIEERGRELLDAHDIIGDDSMCPLVKYNNMVRALPLGDWQGSLRLTTTRRDEPSLIRKTRLATPSLSTALFPKAPRVHHWAVNISSNNKRTVI